MTSNRYNNRLSSLSREDIVIGIFLVPILLLFFIVELVITGINKIMTTKPKELPIPLISCSNCNSPYHGGYYKYCPACKAENKRFYYLRHFAELQLLTEQKE